MRNRMCSPVLLSLNFGILFRPLASCAKKRKEEEDVKVKPVLASARFDTHSLTMCSFGLFSSSSHFLLPPETWWNGVNTVHAYRHSGSSGGGHWAWAPAAGGPASRSPPQPPAATATFPARSCCCTAFYEGVWGSGLDGSAAPSLGLRGLLNPLLLCLDRLSNRQSC